MFRVIPLFFVLVACSGAPQKSLAPELGHFETAFVETGRTEDAWSVAHIVSNQGQYALVVYIRRADGRPAGVVSVDNPSTKSVQFNGIGGAVIPLTPEDMEAASKSGFQTTLCGKLGCYSVTVPATLYQQALLE